MLAWHLRECTPKLPSAAWRTCLLPCPQTAANPQGAQSWANTEGQNFIADHTSPDIDFMSIHLWINNWWVAAALGGSQHDTVPTTCSQLVGLTAMALCQGPDRHERK